MKRKPPEQHMRVMRIYPLFFWTSCFKCGMQVRREWMWRAFDKKEWRADYDGCAHVSSTYFYFCKECCPTKEDAWNERNKLVDMRRTLNSPPQSGSGVTEPKKCRECGSTKEPNKYTIVEPVCKNCGLAHPHLD